jgi:roadblock/LC7 domain-containing protein
MWQPRFSQPLMVVCASTIAFLSPPTHDSVRASLQTTMTVRPAEQAELGLDVRLADHAVYLDGVAGKTYDGVDGVLVEPRGRHVVYMAKRGKDWMVVRDGVEGKPYGYITGLTLSPDGTRVSYRVAGGKSAFSAWGPLVVDGGERTEDPRAEGLSAVFSPDSRRVAYFAAGAHRGKSILVVDNVDGPEFDAEQEGQTRQVVFSPDSRHVAYTARRGTKRYVVVDGVEGAEYDGIVALTLAFSPDSTRVAYGARRGAKEFVVAGGAEGAESDGIVGGSVAFSPDGRRIAYGARRGRNKVRLVLDGVDGKEYDRIEQGSVTFGQDGAHVAYVALRGGKVLVVVDAVEGPEFDMIPASNIRTAIGYLSTWFQTHPERVAPVFSPDGRRVAYSAQRGRVSAVVVDGTESGSYDKMVAQTPVFSPDGRHAAWAASVGGKYRIFVDGSEMKDQAFNTIYTTHEGTLIFDGPSHFHALADVGVAGGKKNVVQFLRVDVEIGSGAAATAGESRLAR